MKKIILLIITLIFTTFVHAQPDLEKVRLYLPFDGNYNDASGKGVTLTESEHINNVDGVITYAEGKFGQAIAFEGKPLITTGLNFTTGEDFTIAAWIYMEVLPTVTGGQTWIHQRDVEGQALGRIHLEVLLQDHIGTFTNGVRVDHFDGETPVPMEAKTWYHVANVHSVTANTRTLYVNGVAVNTVFYEVPIEINSGEFVIAGRKADGNAQKIKNNSRMDDLLITQEALSESLIQQIMGNGVASILGGATSVNEPFDLGNRFSAFYTQGIMHVNTGSSLLPSRVEVYSITGAKVFESSVSASSYNVQLPRGIYIVRAYAKGQVATYKMSAL
jgi:hypothetical protein